MSYQPKLETAGKIVKCYDIDSITAARLSFEINTALAAELEQLASERQHAEDCMIENVKLLNELAAEQEKVDRDALEVTVAFNVMRSAMVALDTLLHAQHNRRHPVPKPVLDLTPTQPLDPETRAEIDATP
jgi:hypothetical protein